MPNESDYKSFIVACQEVFFAPQNKARRGIRRVGWNPIGESEEVSAYYHESGAYANSKPRRGFTKSVPGRYHARRLGAWRLWLGRTLLVYGCTPSMFAHGPKIDSNMPDYYPIRSHLSTGFLGSGFSTGFGAVKFCNAIPAPPNSGANGSSIWAATAPVCVVSMPVPF